MERFPPVIILTLTMTVHTGDRRWTRAHLQGERIGHLNHLFLRCWKDGLCLVRAAKDHGDVKAEPAQQKAPCTKGLRSTFTRLHQHTSGKAVSVTCQLHVTSLSVT